MPIAYLLGAGVSLAGGLPSTADLTTTVLEGEGATRHSDCTYYLRSDPESTPPIWGRRLRRRDPRPDLPHVFGPLGNLNRPGIPGGSIP